MPHRAPQAERVLAELRRALPDAAVSAVDAEGMFEITLEAEDREAALQRVWDATGAAGADDQIVFAEHPDARALAQARRLT